jgi:hypothetical protein
VGWREENWGRKGNDGERIWRSGGNGLYLLKEGDSPPALPVREGALNGAREVGECGGENDG